MPTPSPNDSDLVQPFAALRPRPEYAAAVAAPPYDVMSVSEARAMAEGNERSFLHVSRAEIDLPEGTDPYAEAVYVTAARNLRRLEAERVLVRDHTPAYYAYRIGNGVRSQTGVAVAASVAAYNENRIRRHELTRPAKETDRVRQIEAVNAITGPVMLIHRNHRELRECLGAVTAAAPALLSAEVAGWQHEVWAVSDNAGVATFSRLLNGLDALYIADGHHRSAAAARVAAERSDRPSSTDPRAAHETFLAVTFAEDEVTILDYNRVVSELNGLQSNEFLAALDKDFVIQSSATAVRPQTALTYGLYVDGRWYRLELKNRTPIADPVERLDVSVLDRLVLGPLLSITDPRTDKRIDFIGGARGPEAVAARVDSGEMKAGFTLFPTRLADLLSVADAGRIMPPKSTWFEPKLADGMLSIPLD